LRCRIIAGGANNVLAAPTFADALAARGSCYAPDFCLNAGGIVFLQRQLLGHDAATARQRVRQIGARVAAVLDQTARTGTSSVRAPSTWPTHGCATQGDPVQCVITTARPAPRRSWGGRQHHRAPRPSTVRGHTAPAPPVPPAGKGLSPNNVAGTVGPNRTEPVG
jgi:hypothetical protein